MGLPSASTPRIAKTLWSLLAIIFSSSAPAVGQVPENLAPNFTPHAESDGQGDHWLVFPTAPGWHYLVERSSDLTAFDIVPGGYFYGDGADKRLFLYHDEANPVGAPTASKNWKDFD